MDDRRQSPCCVSINLPNYGFIRRSPLAILLFEGRFFFNEGST
jgi:hypothetical protein